MYLSCELTPLFSAKTIDSRISRLHSRVTCLLLVLFSILVVGEMVFFGPIDCANINTEVPPSFINRWCWAHGTFSVNTAWDKQVGKEVPYPGVDRVLPGDQLTHHTYYKWVPVILLVQAVLFYIPRYVWSSIEGGRVGRLVQQLDSPVLPESTKSSERLLLVHYLKDNLDRHHSYLFGQLLTEFMNLVNVVVQLFLVSFLGGGFLSYGPGVDQTGERAMSRLFPLMIKCTFYNYGSSGDVRKYDNLCVLGVNALNQKLYAILWVWFVLLTIFSVIMVMFRVFSILLPKVYLLETKVMVRPVVRGYLEVIFEKFRLGDWLLLDLLRQNLDPTNFRDVVRDLASELRTNAITTLPYQPL